MYSSVGKQYINLQEFIELLADSGSLTFLYLNPLEDPEGSKQAEFLLGKKLKTRDGWLVGCHTVGYYSFALSTFTRVKSDTFAR